MVADSNLGKDSSRSESHPSLYANLSLGATEVNAGEEVDLAIDIINSGETPVFLTRVGRIIPQGFHVINKPNHFHDTYLDMKGKRLDPFTTEKIRLTMTSMDKGKHISDPEITYIDRTGHQISFQINPMEINITETILPDRISTGYKDLDSLLFGGIPENYAVIMTSPPLDERDLLIERFLETGATKDQITFHITIDPSGAKELAEKFQSIFHLFICNPQINSTTESLPNIHRLKGIENLTDISIAFNKALRRLDKKKIPRRACIEIVSDVLIQHKAVQTRKWLSDLITELKSKGFTIFAVMNPQMHSPQEVHAILGLFEGEITIYEKQSDEYSGKFMKVKRMHGQKYMDSILPLRKRKLQK